MDKDNSIIINKWALGKFVNLMKKYNKRAVKLNVAPIEFDYKITDENIIITWKGEPLKIAGWDFIGTIQHESGDNILRSIPNREIPEHYRNVKPKCEHCNHNRRRKDTFIIHNGGECKQIGRNCLRDFIGHNPDLQIRLLDVIWDVNREESYGLGDLLTNLESFLDMVAAVTLHEGFGRDTGQTTWSHMFPSPLFLAEIESGKVAKIEVSQESKELANKALNWINNTDESNGFINNLKAILKLDYISYREIRLASWIVGAYLKDKEKQLLKQAKIKERQSALDKFRSSDHIGEVGERLEREFELISNKQIVGDYYVFNLVKLLDGDGNVFTWFAYSQPQLPIEGKFKARATVKQHKSYEGIKETVVNRLKVVEL